MIVSLVVEWICWLKGQRKRSPTHEGELIKGLLFILSHTSTQNENNISENVYLLNGKSYTTSLTHTRKAETSKIFSRIAGFFSIRTPAGVDKSGNRYFTRVEEIDGITKEKRWVVFRGEQDPTTIPIEWICWLKGQRKRPPTHEEEEEKKLKDGSIRPVAATGEKGRDTSDVPDNLRKPKEQKPESNMLAEFSEPSGSGASFKPGTWQPPT